MIAEILDAAHPVTLKSFHKPISVPPIDWGKVPEETYEAATVPLYNNDATFSMVNGINSMEQDRTIGIDLYRCGLPYTQPIEIYESHQVALDSSMGSIRETIGLSLDFYALSRELNQARNDSDQELFFFTDVKGFIERHGALALSRLDEILTFLPITARYYYPYLLGHLTDEQTRGLRIAYLYKYVNANDEALQMGAEEAFGYLSAV
jgi:hypothetical protein